MLHGSNYHMLKNHDNMHSGSALTHKVSHESSNVLVARSPNKTGANVGHQTVEKPGSLAEKSDKNSVPVSGGTLNGALFQQTVCVHLAPVNGGKPLVVYHTAKTEDVNGKATKCH